MVRNEGHQNMQISLTAETMKLLDFSQEGSGLNEAFWDEA